MLSKKNENALKAVVFEYVGVYSTCVGERYIWYVCVCVCVCVCVIGGVCVRGMCWFVWFEVCVILVGCGGCVVCEVCVWCVLCVV